MFIEEILKVDQLVFAPQNELKKPKYNKIKIFTEGWQTGVVLTQPPRNSSKQTLEEIRTIQKMYDATTPEEKETITLKEKELNKKIRKEGEFNTEKIGKKKKGTGKKKVKKFIRNIKLPKISLRGKRGGKGSNIGCPNVPKNI